MYYTINDVCLDNLFRKEERTDLPNFAKGKITLPLNEVFSHLWQEFASQWHIYASSKWNIGGGIKCKLTNWLWTRAEKERRQRCTSEEISIGIYTKTVTKLMGKRIWNVRVITWPTNSFSSMTPVANERTEIIMCCYTYLYTYMLYILYIIYILMQRNDINLLSGN